MPAFGTFGKMRSNPPMFTAPVLPQVGAAMGDPFGDTFGDAGDKAITVGFTYRIGSGGYTYKQYPNGDIIIAQTPRGPSGTYIKANPSNASWIAITSEIGPTKVWEAYFKQKGLWPARVRKSASGYAQAASSAASRESNQSAAGARGQGFLNFLQTATGIFTSVTQAQQHAPLPGTVVTDTGGGVQGEIAPVAAPEASPPYLLYGVIGVSALVIVGLALSGGKKTPEK